MKKYNIIYADPPWYYPPRNPTKKFGRGVDSHYPLMKDEDIYNLPVSAMAEKNCALFLWVTGSKLDVGVTTLNRWGFRFATIAFTWIKQNPKSLTLFSGPGHYTKSNTELVLLGLKGSMPVSDKTIKQVLISPRQEHSRKPSEIRNRIELLYPSGSRIELFARTTTPGWDVWGNEIDKFAVEQNGEQ